MPVGQMQYAARRGFYLVLPATKSSNDSKTPPQLPAGWLTTDTRWGRSLLVPKLIISWLTPSAWTLVTHAVQPCPCQCSEHAVTMSPSHQGIIVGRQCDHA